MNEVIRDRSALRQNGHMIWSNRQRARQRLQISSRSAAGVITARSGSPPQTGQSRGPTPVRSTRATIASAARVRIGRIACSSTVSSPSTSAGNAAPEARRFVPGANDEGEPLGVAGDDVDLAEIGGLERFVRAHRPGRRPDEEADVAPVDLQMLETEERPGGEQARRDSRCPAESMEGYSRLDPPLQLQQLDLQINGRREVRLFVFEASELDYFPGFGARLLSFRHAGIVSAGRLVR